MILFSLDVRQQYAACDSRANVMLSDDVCMVALDVYSRTTFLIKHGFQYFEAFPVGLIGHYGRIVHKVTARQVPPVPLFHVFLYFTALFVECEALRECVGRVTNVGCLRV